MGRWTFLALGCVLLSLVTGATAAAQSDGFAIDRFDPAEHGSDWFAGESLDLRGHLRPALGLTLDWAHKPLVLYDADGEELESIVGDQVFAHLGGGVILWNRVRFAANLPLQLSTSGDAAAVGAVTVSTNGNAALGDLRLGGDARLLGEYGDLVTLAVGVQLHLPTGDQDAFAGDGKVRVVIPRVMVAGDFQQFAYSARMGFVYRAQDSGLGGIPTGSELTFVATAGMRLLDRKLLVGPELSGSTVVSEGGAAFEESTTPFEVVLGGHYRIPDWIFALGVGPGLTRGLGSPAVRVLASVEWSPDVKPPPEEEPRDTDGDGIIDDVDACPQTPGEANDDPDKHGCPPPDDRDGDGIVDADDACPDTPGEASDDPEQHGCPPDRDGDGVIDDEDACPDTPGIRTDDPDTNGCPGDRDGDGVRDPDDACPDTPGARNADPKKNGCPLARVEKKQIKIIERIEFETNEDTIRADSEPVLEAVREILAEHPEIELISIEGHTDNVGKAAYNKRLSDRRAAAVVEWLVEHGIEKKRLRSKGFGLEKPIADNDTEEGRQDNRRVEFHIKRVDGKAPADDASVEEEL